MYKTETSPFSLISNKNQFTMDERPRTLKLLEKTPQDISIGYDFLKRSLVPQEIIARINKWDCIELKKKSLYSKGTNYQSEETT
jgi:hypothetical protein